MTAGTDNDAVLSGPDDYDVGPDAGGKKKVIHAQRPNNLIWNLKARFLPKLLKANKRHA